MKTKGIIIFTLSFAIISIALRKLVTNEFDWASVTKDVVSAILFSLLFFTLGMKILKKITEKLMNTVPGVELSKDEKLLLESPANHIKGLEAVGGKLFLTDKRLVFKSHKFNVQNHEQEFPLDQIEAVVQGEGQYEKLVQLTSANDEREKFVVEFPSRLTEILQRHSKS